MLSRSSKTVADSRDETALADVVWPYAELLHLFQWHFLCIVLPLLAVSRFCVRGTLVQVLCKR